jgi:TetR/AcrR family transcriptional regulator, regulator of biofilm formation and stress response
MPDTTTTATSTAARTPDRPRPRGAARREALLEAVLRIVAESGPDAVTHRRVAEVAELPLASTTYWFDSKDHLLTAAFEREAERDTARLLADAAAWTEAARVDPEGAHDPLDGAVDLILDCHREGSPTGRTTLLASYTLVLEAARRPGLQTIAKRWTDAYFTAVEPLLRLAGSAQPHADTELLLAAADGLMIEQLATGTDGDSRPQLRRLAAALVAN